MNRYVAVIALISVAAVAGLVFQQARIAKLESALAATPRVERTSARAVAPAAVAAPGGGRASPNARPAVKPRPEPDAISVAEMPAPVTHPSATSSALTGKVAVANSKPDMGNFMKTIGSMMTNPAMKEMIKQQAKMGLEMQYGRLFKFLDKSPEQTEALKAILMDRQMALMEAGMAFFDGGASSSDRKKKADEVKTVKDTYDKKIEALLGADDYDVFKQYEETQHERMQVEMFKTSLATTGEPLTDQQEFDLVKVMHESRTNSPAMAALMKRDETPDPALFTESGMTNLMAQMEKVQQDYAAAAAKILSPAQNEKFTKFLDQQKAMTEMGMKFAAQMFGGDDKGETPAASEKPAP